MNYKIERVLLANGTERFEVLKLIKQTEKWVLLSERSTFEAAFEFVKTQQGNVVVERETVMYYD